MSIKADKKNEVAEGIEERPLPSLDVAEAKIALSLIRYQIRVAKGTSLKEEEKEKVSL